MDSEADECADSDYPEFAGFLKRNGISSNSHHDRSRLPSSGGTPTIYKPRIFTHGRFAEYIQYGRVTISKWLRMERIDDLPGLQAFERKHAVSAAPLNAVYLRGHNRVPRVRVFIDFLRERLASSP